MKTLIIDIGTDKCEDEIVLSELDVLYQALEDEETAGLQDYTIANISFSTTKLISLECRLVKPGVGSHIKVEFK